LAKDVKARKKFKLLSSIMITIAYIFCSAYNLTATWFIMTYTLQYGREDSEQWIMDFFNVFTYDFFIAEPISIVGNGVLVKPLLALLVMPYLKKLKNRIKPPKKTKVAPIESRALPSFYGGGELLVPQGLIEPELNANEVTTTDAARSSDTTVSLLPVESTTVSLQSQVQSVLGPQVGCEFRAAETAAQNAGPLGPTLETISGPRVLPRAAARAGEGEPIIPTRDIVEEIRGDIRAAQVTGPQVVTGPLLGPTLKTIPSGPKMPTETVTRTGEGEIIAPTTHAGEGEAIAPTCDAVEKADLDLD